MRGVAGFVRALAVVSVEKRSATLFQTELSTRKRRTAKCRERQKKECAVFAHSIFWRLNAEPSVWLG